MGYIFFEELMDLSKYFLIYGKILHGEFASRRRKIAAMVMALVYLYTCTFVATGTTSVIKKLVIFIILGLLFQGKLKNKIMIFPIVWLVITSFDTFIMVMAGFIVYKNPLFFILDRMSLGYLFLSSVFLLCLCCFIRFSNFSKENDWLNKKISRIQYLLLFGCLLGVFLLISLVVLYINIGEQMEDKKIFNYLFLLFVSLTICCFIGLFMNIQQLDWKNQLQQNQLDAYQHYNEAQSQYYKMLQERNEEIRRYRHDIRHHLTLLHMWAKEEEIVRIEEYLKGLLNREEEIGRELSVNTGNQVVDSVIAGIMSRKDAKHIRFICQGHLPAHIPIDDIDLCGLVANALENAVEANNGVTEEAYIDIGIKLYYHQITFVITNSCNGVICDKDKVFISSQKGREHGYGMLNMQTIVRKYNGKITYDRDAHEFRLCIILNCNS